jgi:hypothetical protein
LQLNQNPNQALPLPAPGMVSSETAFFTPMHTTMNTPRNTPVRSLSKSDDSSSDDDFVTATEELDMEPLELTSPFGSPKKEAVPEAPEPLFQSLADDDCSAALPADDKAPYSSDMAPSGDDAKPTKQNKQEASSGFALQGLTSRSEKSSPPHLEVSESSDIRVHLEEALPAAEEKVHTRTIGTQTDEEPVIAAESHEVIAISHSVAEILHSL